MFRCNQCPANEVKLSKCENELRVTKEAIQASDATISDLRKNLRDALDRDGTSESSTALYTLASELCEGLYKLKFEEAERKRKVAEGEAVESEKAVCDLGHQFVEILVHQNFAQESIQQRHLQAEKVISEVMDIERKLIRQHLLDETGIRKSQKQYCSVLRQLAATQYTNDETAAYERLKCVELMHRSIWEQRDEAEGLNQDDSWVLENGHQLGLVLAELKKTGENHYRLAEIQLEQVWNTRKRSPAFGPMHDDTVDSALQLVSMLEKQKKLEEKQKLAYIEEILRETWSPRGTGITAGVLNCGYKLGDYLYQQRKYADAEAVLSEVWTTREDALERASKEGADARSTGFVLACTLHYQRTQEKYELAKAILKKLWAKKKSYMLPDASPSNDAIGWRLARTYRMLKEYASAEPVFQLICESRKADIGANNPKTLAAQYELGLTQVLQKHWAKAEHNFQHVWEKLKDVTGRESEEQNTSTRLRAGHQLGVCLSEQSSYPSAIKVLQAVYSERVTTLGEDDKDTKKTQKKLEEAQKSLAVQTKEEKAKAETARAEGIKQRKREEKEASDKIAREEALREEGRAQIRFKVWGRYWMNKK